MDKNQISSGTYYLMMLPAVVAGILSGALAASIFAPDLEPITEAIGQIERKLEAIQATSREGQAKKIIAPKPAVVASVEPIETKSKWRRKQDELDAQLAARLAQIDAESKRREVEINAKYDRIKQKRSPKENFVILGFRTKTDVAGWLCVVGEVKNVGRISQGVKVQAIVRNKRGQVLGTETFWPGSGNIAPSESCAFDEPIGVYSGIDKVELKIASVHQW